MCTVSIVAAQNKTIYTFNRDEQPTRHATVFFETLILPTKEVYFAKDATAGGTWFAADNQGNVAMLFNGAFEKHTKLPKHNISRGIILLNIISADNLLAAFQNIDMYHVEPFSIILHTNGQSVRATWDGDTKHIQQLKQYPYIFSSATLYDTHIQKAREEWLTDFLASTANVNEEHLVHFHTTCQSHDIINGLKIDRPTGCKTLSVSQAVVDNQQLILRHLDLIHTTEQSKTIILQQEQMA